MSDQTALERAALVVAGERAELRVEAGRVTIGKDAPVRAAPTTVEFAVDQIRGTQLHAPSRGAPGWLHVSVVGGSPTPPGELAAAGDPYTLPVTSRSLGAARRFAKLVDRHVRERGMPHDSGPDEGRLSPGVTITQHPPGPVPATDGPPPPSGSAPSDAAAVPSSAVPPPVAAPRPSAAPPPGAAELVAELQVLAELRASGALSEEEFERAKARVLD